MARERWKLDLKSKKTWALLIVSLIPSGLSAWGLVHLVAPLIYLGFPGVMVFVMVAGVHGTMNVVGGILFVIVNTAFYFFVFRFFMRRLPSNSG